MEEISSKEDKVDIGVSSYLQDLAESVDRVLTANWVFFGVADVIVGCEQYAKAATREQGS
jgi:hypothetical protein